MSAVAINLALYCYHCGEFLKEEPIIAHDKNFCCIECKNVYELLEKGGLLDYYTLTESPGCCHKSATAKQDFSCLDEQDVQEFFIVSKNSNETHAVLHLPEIHCSSCWWLIDNLHKLDENITNSTVDFPKRQAHIYFNHNKTTLRKVAELLSAIGYEADINCFKNRKKSKRLFV